MTSGDATRNAQCGKNEKNVTHVEKERVKKKKRARV